MATTEPPEHVGQVNGLTPLIGILLMVLITLLVAAILGTFIVG